jgi:hypothetical protein
MVINVSLKSHQKRAVWVVVLFFTALVYASSRRGDTRDVDDVISMTNTVVDARSGAVTGDDVVATSETTEEQRYAANAPLHSPKELEVLRVTWGVFKPCDETAGCRRHGVDLKSFHDGRKSAVARRSQRTLLRRRVTTTAAGTELLRYVSVGSAVLFLHDDATPRFGSKIRRGVTDGG